MGVSESSITASVNCAASSSTSSTSDRRLRSAAKLTELEHRMVMLGETSATREYHAMLATSTTTVTVVVGGQTKDEVAASTARLANMETSNLNAEASVNGLPVPTTTLAQASAPGDAPKSGAAAEDVTAGAATAVVSTGALAALIIAGVALA